MSRNKEVITLTIPPGSREKLETIAANLGIFWGKSPSPSGLISAIAENKLEVGAPFTLNQERIKAILAATQALIDVGNLDAAQTLLKLLLERSNLEPSLRQKAISQVSEPLREGWRILIDKYIENKQPFKLIYRDSQARDLEYTVRFAQIDFHEKRYFLNIWCEESDDLEALDFPELIHNRCLRLDRIRGILDLEGQWRDRLDYLRVELQFLGTMVKAYEPRLEDISDRREGEFRIVERTIFNPFWLIREILNYGNNCLVLNPINLRRKVYQELKNTISLYEVD
jgi:predicted DNA-binding transcriptional regulator YafY